MFKFFRNFFIDLKDKEDNLIKIIKKHLDWERELIRKLFSQKTKGIKFSSLKKLSLKQLKYLPSLLSKKEKITLGALLILTIFSLSILFLRIYLHLPLKPSEGGEYTEGIIGQPSLINPIFISPDKVEADVARLVFSGLIKWQNGEAVPDLAEKWEIENEGKTFVFYLRKNVFWHDGQKFNADDVVFTFQAIQDKRTKSPLRESFLNVEIQKINDEIVRFSLEKPFSPFLSFLTFGVLPKHLWQKIPPENFISHELNFSLIGTGPFKLKRMVKNKQGEIESLTLEKNKRYYLKSPYLSKLNLKFLRTKEEGLENLKTKKIEGLSSLGKNQIEESLLKTVNYYQLPLSYYTAIFFNQKSEVLSNKKIREALSLSLNKQEIVKNLKNVELMEGALINQDFKIEKIKNYEYNPLLAKEVLKEIGWQKKGQWLTDKNNRLLEIKLITSDHLRHSEIAEVIKDFWQDLGIKTDLKIFSKDDLLEEIKKRNYDALLYSLIEGYDPDPFSLWHSSQIESGLNLSNFKNIKVDALLEKARIVFDKSERKKYYTEFQEIISKEIPVIFLYQKRLDYFLDQKIKGFKSQNLIFPSDRFNNIENWYIYTKRSKK
ncbi:MAG: ABC transporter substrate-binding protein [Patescibacteria group bacterium]|nr:ABC transporter substrate-binding protein [Patescibacteria group bacterium]